MASHHGAFGDAAVAMNAPFQQPSPSATPLAATTPTAGRAPSGETPNAKRPMDRGTIDVALSGTRTMSNEDLCAGFLNLQKLRVRDGTFSGSMAQSVHWNAELLNKLITRVNAIKPSAKLAAAETKSLHEGVNDLSIVRDKKLRDELDVTIKALQVDLERLEKAGTPVQPTSVPDLGWANERFEQLQQQVAEGAARLAESTEHLQA